VAAVKKDAQLQLAWEARHRSRAAIAALISVAGLIVTYVLQGMLTSGVPIPSGLEALQRAAQPGAAAELPSLQLPVLEFLDGRAPMQLATAVAGLLAYLAMGWAVGFLGVAARARRDAS